MKFYLFLLIFNIYFMITSVFLFNSYYQPNLNQTETDLDEDIIEVQNKNYYDEYSFKTNWADDWSDSSINPTGWFPYSK